MKNNKVLLSSLMLILVLGGCNSSNSSSNSNQSSIFNSSSEVSSSSSSSFDGYVDLFEAFSNTQYYGLRVDANYVYYVEIYTEDMYYSTFNSTGYIALDSDPDFIHAFESYRISDDSIDTSMYVYGRTALKEGLKVFEEKNFINIFTNFISKFTQTDENIWEYESSSLCKTLSNFFQLNMIKYCNLVEFTIGKDDRLESFNMYESSGNAKTLIYSCKLDNVKAKDLDMYKRWEANDGTIKERIIDYKMLYEEDDTLVSCYNNEIVEFEATVVAIDSNGNVYVANEDKKNGNVGIKVTPSSSDSVKIGDIVNVKGKITTRNYVPSVTSASIFDTGEDAFYPPTFDEEIIVDNYGGGTYAAQIFSTVPYYSGSVYSTYAYVSEIPESLNANSDTIIEVVCPTYTSGEVTYHMEVIIPYSLDILTKEALFNEFKNAGIYGEEGAYELNLSRYVIQFDADYFYGIKLMATSDSETFKRLNAQEKVEKYVGLSSFPVIEDETMISYKFGGSSGYYLEKNYGITTKETNGIYIGYSEISSETFEVYLEEVEMYGAELIDQVKDLYSGVHRLYKYNETIIDIQYVAQYGQDSASVNIWVYNGTLLRMPSIQEKLDTAIGSWFDANNFLVLDDTFDSEYTVFTLLDYANLSYTQENPLYCVALDTQENIRDKYCLALVQKLGYSQYRVDGQVYTYKSRGQVHYLFQKEGVFMDVASYPTTDYTYTGHDDYQYRLEILIYQGDEPISIPTYDSLDVLCNKYSSIDESLAYSPNLPSDAVVEIWNDLGSYKLIDVEYGYGCRDEAFVYTSDVDGAYQALQDGLIDAGYTKTSERANSVSFSKTVNNNTYYIFILKENDKGYVRFMHGVGGVDFSR